MNTYVIGLASTGLIMGYIVRDFDLYSNESIKLAIFIIGISVIFYIFNKLDIWLRKVCLAVLTFATAFVIGNIYYNQVLSQIPNINSKVNILVNIQKVELNEKYKLIYSDVLDESLKDKKIKNIIFYDFNKEDFVIGDTYEVSGTLSTHKLTLAGKDIKTTNFALSKYNSFDLMDYYRTKGVDAILDVNEIKKVNTEVSESSVSAWWNGTYIKSKASTLKQSIREILYKYVSTQEAGILLAMTTGDESGISKEARTNFNASSLSHVLVLSGYNLSILIAFCFVLFRKWSRTHRVLLTTLVMSLYFCLIEINFPIIRAGIMSMFVLLSFLLLRKNNLKNLIWTALLIITLIFPYEIIKSISLQLSLVATFSIIYFAPPINEIFKKYLTEFLSNIVSVSLAVSVLSMPYVAYAFGQINLLSVIVNIVAAPLVTIIMIIGFAWLLIGIFYTGLIMLNLKLGVISHFATYVITLYGYMSDFFVSKLVSLTTASYTKIPVYINLSFTSLLIYYLVICIIYFITRSAKIND